MTDSFLSFFNKEKKDKKKKKIEYKCSMVFGDDFLAEMVYDPDEMETKFAIFTGGEITYENNIEILDGWIIKPLSARGNIVKKKLVLFPIKAEEYQDNEELLKEIQGFIHKYIQVNPVYEKMAAFYVLFTWVHDRFNELPYLRALGDWGTGKTRALKTIGSLCYKPIFAAGAVTASPIFRILDITHGTLVMDEADFKISGSWAEIIKILNCGYQKDIPVLRSESTGRTFEPRAFSVYGPKIIATRKRFDDQALESRCLTEEMQKMTRGDIPFNLADGFWEEAAQIRNKLLLWRFKNFSKIKLKPELADRSIEPRLNQIMIPLLSIIEDKKVIEEIKQSIRNYNQQLILDRGMQEEAEVLEITASLIKEKEPSMKDIAYELNEKHGLNDFYYKGKKFTARQIGGIIRNNLNLHPKRNYRGYVIPFTEKDKITRLKEKYGLKKDLEEKTEKELQKEADELEKEQLSLE